MQAITTSPPHVNVIVLNWNGKDDTLLCLESLARMAYPNFRITVVDNGSTDGSVESLRCAHPEVEILCTGRNLGYAGGNNVGLRAALDDGRSQYVLVLNNDTEVDATLLDVLVETAEAKGSLAVYGPRIFFKDAPQRVWFAGAYWKPDQLKFEHVHYREILDDARTTPYATDYVTGCALLMSVTTLRNVGLLDERFFLIYEEVDWCYRLRKLGGECLVVPRASIWHRVSASFGGEGSPLVHYFAARNGLLWSEKALSFRQHCRLLAESLAGILLPEVLFKHKPPAALLKRIYWAFRSPSSWHLDFYRDRRYRTHAAGVRDYMLRRFGNCPESVRRAA